MLTTTTSTSESYAVPTASEAGSGVNAAPNGAPRPALRFDPDQALRFLSLLTSPRVGCCEFRIFHASFDKGSFIVAAQQWSKTLAGWYDDPSRLVADAGRLRGVSGYVTINPVTMDLLARSDSRIAKARHATLDDNVTCLRWLYIDIDSVRAADISSTDAELAAAVSRRDAILSDHPDMAVSAMWGRSGNGAWILVRLDDLPNTSSNRERIGRSLDLLASRYTDKAVKVDSTTRNPSRVMCLPGTIKAKGSNRPERPWRMVTLDYPRMEPTR